MTTKILFITTESTTAYLFILPFARYLREQDYQVSFACSGESYPEAPSRIVELRSEGFRVVEIPIARTIRPFQDIQAFVSLAGLLHSEKFDLIHTHNSKAGFIGRIAAAFSGCPVIIHTAHDLFYREYKRGIRKGLYILLEKLAAVFCDVILFVSSTVLDDAVRYHIKTTKKLILVGGGIDARRLGALEIDNSVFCDKYGIAPSEAYIGCVSRLVPHKGIETLMRAFVIVLQDFPNARLLIAGGGPLRSDLESLTNYLGLSRHVKFLGYLPDEDVLKLIGLLHVFVLPTRREGLGIAYLEAMALGCPVVGSKIPPVTEIIEHGKTGLLATVDDPKAFASAIVSLLWNPQLRKRIASDGSEHVKNKFDIDQVFERIESLYQKLLIGLD